MAVDDASLLRWRNLDAGNTLSILADYAKRDPDFRPTENPGTSRWHASVGN